jgi:DNA-directed RNA polymerase specialized sigma24 family protein
LEAGIRSSLEQEYIAYVQERALPLRRTVYHLGGDWYDPADLVQETMIKPYLHWERLQQPEARNTHTRQILFRNYADRSSPM